MATHASERIRPGNARRARDLAAVGLRRGDGVLRGAGRVDQPAGAVVMARGARFLAVALLAHGIARWATPRLGAMRSEEHTSELQSLMRTSYAVFCLKKKKKNNKTH